MPGTEKAVAKLTNDEIVTLEALRLKGEPKAAIARRLGITEGAVCFHLKRRDNDATDGRSKVSPIPLLVTLGISNRGLET